MNKAEEITALQNFANSYPQNTYLRAYLTALVPIVEAHIRADIEPTEPAQTLESWSAAKAKQAVEQQRRAIEHLQSTITGLKEQVSKHRAELEKVNEERLNIVQAAKQLIENLNN